MLSKRGAEALGKKSHACLQHRPCHACALQLRIRTGSPAISIELNSSMLHASALLRRPCEHDCGFSDLQSRGQKRIRQKILVALQDHRSGMKGSHSKSKQKGGWLISHGWRGHSSQEYGISVTAQRQNWLDGLSTHPHSPSRTRQILRHGVS